MAQDMNGSPIAAIPLHVAGRTFAVMPTCSARYIAHAMTPPPDETNLAAIERVAGTIASLILDEQDRAAFLALLGDPTDPAAEGITQGELLDVWEQMVVHYCARPTDGPSPSSFGRGTPGGGSTSTPTSPSAAAPVQDPSPMTSDG